MSQPALSRAKISLLMVDDNVMGLQARKAVLEELGYRVTTAGSAEDALETLTGGPAFDIVITDFKLPAKNGVDLIKEILARKLPVFTVLLSGFVEAMGLNEANTGADVVLQKSSHELAHLVRSVKSLVKKRKPMGEAGAPSGPERKKA
jgi:CheY-like chemotaxis protein